MITWPRESELTTNLPLIGQGFLTVGLDASPLPPLHMGDPADGEFQGFEVDLTEAVARDLGLAVVHRPFLRSEMLQGEHASIDLACTAASPTGGRARAVEFSEPYLDAQLVVVARTPSAVQSLADLAHATAGVRLATRAAEHLQESTAAGCVRQYGQSIEMYAALARGEVDALVDDYPIASWFVRNVPDLAIVERVRETEACYAMMFARGNLLREAIDLALRRIRRDGRYTQLLTRWFGAEAAFM